MNRIAARLGIVFTIALFSFPRLTVAQTLSNELKRMYETMLNAESLWMETLSVTRSFDETAPVVSEGLIQMKGSLLHVEMYNLIMVADKNWHVMVDKTEREIYVKPAGPSQKPAELIKAFMPALDQMLGNMGEPASVTHADGSRGYQIKDQSGMFSSIELYFDAASGLMKRIIYHYPHEEDASGFSTMEINFGKLEVNPVLPQDAFDISAFVIRSGETWKAAKGFDSYSVIAQ